MEESNDVDQTELLDTWDSEIGKNHEIEVTCEEKSSIMELDSVAVDISSDTSRMRQGWSFKGSSLLPLKGLIYCVTIVQLLYISLSDQFLV